MAQNKRLEAETTVEAINLTTIELSEFVKLFEQTFEVSVPGANKSSSGPAGLPESEATSQLFKRFQQSVETYLERRNAMVALRTGTEGRHSTADRMIMAAVNMERSVEALGPALAAMETPVSPQLARSMAATENAWREMESEFGLLSSLEVSELAGSRSPNRSYASEQHAKGRLVAIKRPGGLRYPGFQIDRSEHAILSVMAELISVAAEAGRSEASLALWMTSPSGYLDGDRPVDRLSDAELVVGVARQSFNVEW
jgi:hypothetical protein